ncbi:unnamed protein product [Ectocarpus sp. 4 AP-2014]
MGGPTRHALGLCCLLGLGLASGNPTRFREGCGGWKHCLETHYSTGSKPLIWFQAWNQTIQPKLDQLLVTSGEQQEGWPKENGIQLIFSGDSTLRQQFQVLGEFLKLRNDFQPVAGNAQAYEMTFGAPRQTPGSVTFLLMPIYEKCLLAKGNPYVAQAYAMYFGCGMHLLHLFPVQESADVPRAMLRRVWENYDTLLSERIGGWREVNPDIKLVYMTTHTIDESKYYGEWKTALEGYKARDPAFLEPCKLKFEEILPQESPLRDDLEQVCIDTVFGAHGVQLLNEQGLAVMKEMGVPVVPAHMLVKGQQWATPDGDGRHFPYLIPLELFWLFNILEGLS